MQRPHNIELGGRGYQRINARYKQNRTNVKSIEKRHLLKVSQLLLSLIVGVLPKRPNDTRRWPLLIVNLRISGLI